MLRFAAVVLVWAVACSSDDESDGGTCGEAGCACTPERGCELGFECNSAIDRCVPADCEPGFLDCVCSMGMCANGLGCNDGLCTPGGNVTTGPQTTGTDSSGTATDTGASTSADDETATSPTSDGPGEDADGPGEESSSTQSSEPTCADERDCDACFQCAIADEGPCASDHGSCQDDAQCMGLETCATNCTSSGEGGDCVNQCCALFEDGDQPPYSQLSACLNDACGDLCPDFAC